MGTVNITNNDWERLKKMKRKMNSKDRNHQVKNQVFNLSLVLLANTEEDVLYRSKPPGEEQNDFASLLWKSLYTVNQFKLVSILWTIISPDYTKLYIPGR